MKRLIFILTILTLAYAGEAPAIQRRPKSLSPESLYRSAQAHFNKEDYEKALAEFTAIAEDYVEGGSPEDAELPLKANKMLWHLYEFVYYDHSKAYEAALRAQEIADALGKADPEISFSLGSICQTLSEQGDDPELMERAYGYFMRCAGESLDGDAENEYLDMAVSNILSLARESGRMRNIEGLWKRYTGKRVGSLSGVYAFNKFYHEVLTLAGRGRYDEAVSVIDTQLCGMAESNDMRRYAAATYLLKSEILGRRQDSCLEVIAALEKMLQVAMASDLKDGVLLANKLLWKHYASGACADRERALSYRSAYLEMKDSILSYRQVAAMKEIGAQRQIGLAKREMDTVRQRYVVMTVVLLAVMVLLAVTFFFYWQLRRKNRELSFKNESLYRFSQRDIENEKADDEASEDVREKYSTSGLTEADSERLARRIEEVFADPAEICNEEFSAQRLAAILDTSYPYVSQVINTRYGCNFNAMLNRSRIREACRIMNDPAQARVLTIEGISHKVGFKSRTTFINSFKKATGMTPSEYLKVASGRKGNGADGMSEND